ncbi:hypothetical protein CBE89_13280 (plasmid) [Corynebacterium striatum]|uniref:Cardiolipin synthase N-terminal domain-containing protein n=2 Tax=Corynebacterium striatum TaxID=43770 RepID=A0A2Z2J060_CORST|nr:hypothetical protein CBE89_13280 [Corynebacterium striatum]
MDFSRFDSSSLNLLQSSQPVWFWGVTGSVIAVLTLFWIAAMVSIFRSSFAIGEKVLFILGTLAFPLLGPLTWFLFINRKDQSTVRRS